VPSTQTASQSWRGMCSWHREFAVNATKQSILLAILIFSSNTRARSRSLKIPTFQAKRLAELPQRQFLFSFLSAP
jgi:hypothetical protein